MPSDATIDAILGLNNRLKPTRMETVTQNRSAASWLRVASNIDLSADGFIRRRQGFYMAAAGGWHSIWADENCAYGVCNGDLVHIDTSLAATVVVPGIGRVRASFARLPDGMVYWTNGALIGRIDGKSARAVVTPPPNPVPIAFPVAGSLPPGSYQVCFTGLGADGESASTEPQQISLRMGGGIAFAGLAQDTRVYATGPDGAAFNEIAPGAYLSLGNLGAECATFMRSPMPAGHALAHYRGSLLVARGQFLYLSEPYRYGLTNAGRAFIPFPAQISVVQPCEDGIYVCADKTYWIPGDPLNTQPVVVLPYGGLPGTALLDRYTQTAYWQGPQGVVVAKPGGVVEAPQDDALIFNPARSGASLLREQDGERHVIAARFDVERTEP